MIHVIAQIEIRSGTRDAFLAEFHKLVPLVRAEEGCLEYGPTLDAETDIDAQQRNPQRVTIVEKWESLGHLKAHLAAPHMAEYRSQVADFVAGMTLHILEPA
ncbi:MAG: putative quinol monooxygenase [Planctomycetaceae bacterium]